MRIEITGEGTCPFVGLWGKDFSIDPEQRPIISIQGGNGEALFELDSFSHHAKANVSHWALTATEVHPSRT